MSVAHLQNILVVLVAQMLNRRKKVPMTTKAITTPPGQMSVVHLDVMWIIMKVNS